MKRKTKFPNFYDLNYKQAVRFYDLKPFGDIDRDGVVNSRDCRPFNPFRQDEPTDFSFQSEIDSGTYQSDVYPANYQIDEEMFSERARKGIQQDMPTLQYTPAPEGGELIGQIVKANKKTIEKDKTKSKSTTTPETEKTKTKRKYTRRTTPGPFYVFTKRKGVWSKQLKTDTISDAEKYVRQYKQLPDIQDATFSDNLAYLEILNKKTPIRDIAKGIEKGATMFWRTGKSYAEKQKFGENLQSGLSITPEGRYAAGYTAGRITEPSLRSPYQTPEWNRASPESTPALTGQRALAVHRPSTTAQPTRINPFETPSMYEEEITPDYIQNIKPRVQPQYQSHQPSYTPHVPGPYDEREIEVKDPLGIMKPQHDYPSIYQTRDAMADPNRKVPSAGYGQKRVQRYAPVTAYQSFLNKPLITGDAVSNLQGYAIKKGSGFGMTNSPFSMNTMARRPRGIGLSGGQPMLFETKQGLLQRQPPNLDLRARGLAITRPVPEQQPQQRSFFTGFKQFKFIGLNLNQPLRFSTPGFRGLRFSALSPQIQRPQITQTQQIPMQGRQQPIPQQQPQPITPRQLQPQPMQVQRAQSLQPQPLQQQRQLVPEPQQYYQQQEYQPQQQMQQYPPQYQQQPEPEQYQPQQPPQPEYQQQYEQYQTPQSEYEYEEEEMVQPRGGNT